MKSFIHDQYEPYKKVLADGYSIPYAIKGILVEKKPKEEMPFTHLFIRPIHFGDKGYEVSCLQEVLRREGVLNCLSTGNYQKLTRQAVKDLQLKYNIAPIKTINEINGMEVGPITRKFLNSKYAPTVTGSWFSDLITRIAGLFR